MRWGAKLAAVAVAAVLIPAAPAAAAPDCPGAAASRVALSGQGLLESAVVDARGRLFYTDGTRKALMRLDHPGARPAAVRAGIEAPGGLVFDADGRHLFVGSGNSLAGGLLGNVAPAARLLRVDVETGRATTYATGLMMANGLARAADGTIYASDDVGIGIDRVRAGGKVDRGWSPVLSGNGLALSPDGRTLYAAQTFVPAAVARVPVARPREVRDHARAGLLDAPAGLDGMTIDAQGVLYVTANAFGELWRVDRAGRICVLARGMPNASAVALGQGQEGFAAGSAVVVTFGGLVVEVPLG